MLRPLAMFWIVFVLMLGVGVFQVEFRVDGLRTELNEIHRQMADDRRAIHVLKAEWAYLTNPERLQKISAKHLNLNEVASSQISSIENIPMRLVARDTIDPRTLKIDVALSMVGRGNAGDGSAQ